MNTCKGTLTAIRGLAVAAFLFAGLCSPGIAATGTILPAGVVIADTFMPGFGAPIGSVQRVRGDVVVMHAENAHEGYRARPGLPLYRGDTVTTLKRGKIRFRMNDGSILSLASETKLELNQSVYDKKKKSRSSFLRMAFGKARFFVVKLLKFKRSEFKVKTPTAVCGVRGSDFVLEASAEVTIATALEKTSIELAGLVDPAREPVVLTDYQSSRVYAGGYPSKPVNVSPEAVKRLLDQFISVAPEDYEPEAGEIQAGKGIEAIVKADVRVLVPEKVIVAVPEDFETKEVRAGDIYRTVVQSGVTKERPSTVRVDIIEQAKEGYLGNLPDFPQMPE
ncbi:MAG: FecR family protein [Deltaproteobacteria bacterium]|nr:FecR family protein [Deltaproteobacteria bacterium]